MRILYLKNSKIKSSRQKPGCMQWTHGCLGAWKGLFSHSFLPIFALIFFVEPLEWLILVLFVHVAKPLYFRFKIARRPVNLAVLLSSLTQPPLLLHSIPLYFHFFPPFFLFPFLPPELQSLSRWFRVELISTSVHRRTEIRPHYYICLCLYN